MSEIVIMVGNRNDSIWEKKRIGSLQVPQRAMETLASLELHVRRPVLEVRELPHEISFEGTRHNLFSLSHRICFRNGQPGLRISLYRLGHYRLRKP